MIESLLLKGYLFNLLYSCLLLLDHLVYLLAFGLSLWLRVIKGVVKTSQFVVIAFNGHNVSFMSISC